MTTKVQSSKLPFENKDLLNIRKEYLYEMPKFMTDRILPFMADKRDMPMIHLLFNICTTMLPFAALLFMTDISGWKHLLGAVHIVMIFLYAGRFILCMHYSSHRFVFTKYSAILNNIQTMLICPFFGIPTGMYFLHHVVMHHCEGNLFPDDWSSTMMYQRDNFLHFLHYWGKFLTSTYFYLPYYAAKKNRYDLVAQSVLGTLSYWYLLYAGFKYNPWAAIYVGFIPHLLISLALMFGNWSQHMFLEPKDPLNPYLCTYNCMNALDNQATFNDGYHIVHHVNSRLHWSEMPQDFMNNLPKYASLDCLVFDGIGFFEVGLFCFLGWYEKLAKHTVQWGFLGGPQRSIDETVAMLKERLVPMPPAPKKGKSA